MAEQISQQIEGMAAEGVDIVARFGKYFRYTRYAITVMFVIFGLWFVRDSFSRWPAENAANKARGQKEIHSDTDIMLNKVLGILLPPLGIFVLIRAMYQSRGEYRLSGNTLYIPGHSPISLDAIRVIDKRLWDRKGIAHIEYDQPGGGVGGFKLDDFIYERGPTDEIFERIEAHATAAKSVEAPASPNSPQMG